MLTINGTTHEFEEEVTLEVLLHQLNLAEKPCAVEVNQQLVNHNCRKEHIIRDGDAIEIVSLVGGG